MTSTKVATEINRLKNHGTCQFEYGLNSMLTTRRLLISSLNTRSLLLHIDDVANDHELMQANILCLQ